MCIRDSYKIASFFKKDITLMEVAKLAPVVMVMLSVVPAFLLGKELSNEWGGILTALFIISAPTFIGVSMGGYCDTDAVVVFYTFLSVYSLFLAIKKKSLPLYVFSFVTLVWFIFNWWFGWYVIIFFILLIPAVFIFRIIEYVIHKRKVELNIHQAYTKMKEIVLPLLVIVLLVNVFETILSLIMYPYNKLPMNNLFGVFLTGSKILRRKALIVDVSVAELQPINIFTKSGFMRVAGRTGLFPTIVALFGLPIIAFYKVYKKKEVTFIEIFLFMWMLLTFIFILRGVRFALLFSCAIAASAGYVLGNLIRVIENQEVFIRATVFGMIVFISLFVVSDAIQMGYGQVGMEVEPEWIEMLEWLKNNADPKAIVATWWDPGHIIAGYTGLRVHADGAHCPPTQCIPYNHNIRIKDMGRVLVTNNETEAVEILRRYMQLSPEDCQKVKGTFGDIVPEEACEPASEMYFIASNDLIFKYPWHSYFGDWNNVQKQYMLLGFSKYVTDDQGRTMGLSYGDDTIIILFRNDKMVPILNKRYVVKEVLYYKNGKLHDEFVENGTVGSVLLLGDIANQLPSQVVFMPIDHEESEKFLRCQEISCDDGEDNNFNGLVDEKFTLAERDSMFTKMFFLNGEGLEHFKLVFSNSKIKLYKVEF